VTRPPGISTLFSALGLLGFLGTMAGCTWLPGRTLPEARVDPGQARFTAGLHAAEAADFEGAREALGDLVARCESGPWGRDAVLVLGALELSPRNPAGTPAVAAGLLARYLQEPAAPPPSVILAETLYLAALDRGADPVGNPFVLGPGLPPVAPRFAACHRDSDPDPVRTLPTLPEPGATRDILDRVQVERDSLAALADSLSRRNEALEAELDRIRRLLLPDTVRSGGTPARSRP
jgi:hypothetical protein